MNLDPQTKAVHLTGTDIIISASAGSGKTFTLIERLKKRIIEDGLSMDQICALTFTEAAASEMKERLLKALLKEYQLTKNERLTKEISLVETAQITTIHGFCLNIIKNYGYILNLDPDRTGNIFSDGVITKLKKQALDITLQKAYAENDEAINLLLEAYVDNPAYLMNLEDCILDTAKYLSTFTHRQQEINRTLSIYNTKTFAEFPSMIQEGFFAYHKHHLTLIYDKVDAFLEEVSSVFFEHKKDTYTNLIHTLGSLDELLKLIDKEDISFHSQIPSALKTLVIPMFRGAFTEDLDKERYTSLSDAYTQCVNNLLFDYEPLEAMINTLNSQHDLVKALLEISLDYLNTFDTLKENAGGYDFDDFIYYTMMILEHNDFYIANILKEQYEEIMVDEFQDTNNIQNDIINAISKGNNIFRVGDLKQSIYGFQGARPALMRSMLHQPHNETIHFKYNYRSKDNLVSYNNTLFSNLMNTLDEGSYDQKDLASVKPHVKDKNGLDKVNIQTQRHHSIDFNIYTHGEASNRNFDAKHALLIADTIYELMNQGLTIDYEDDENNLILEPLDFKHITVLVRGHSAKTALKAAFDSANIPHNIVNHQGFFQSDLMKQTIDWLRYSITSDSYYLVSILSSPYIGLSLDDISKLRIHSKHDPLIKSLSTLYPLAYETIMTTLEAWKNMDLVEALIYLSTLNDAYQNAFSLQAKTNFDFLLEKASNYQSMGNPSILGFVDYIDALSEKSRFSSEVTDRVSESKTLDKDANYVNVATMHASKGLQYPLTIIWPDKAVNQRDSSKNVVSDDLYTLSIKDTMGPFYSQRTSLLRTLTTHKQSIENIQEYLRLFYVALTRATHKLVIVDLVSEKHVLETTLDTYLLHNFKSASQLIAAGSPTYFDASQHVKPIDINNYMGHYSFKALMKDETSDIETFTIPNYPHLETPPTMNLEFFPNFLEATQYGTNLHKALEELPHRLWTEDDLNAYAQNIKNTLMNYNTHAFTQELYTYPTIEHEMPILYRSDKGSVQGYIDFYAVNHNSVVLVDFKSDATDIDTIKQRYIDQIENYKKALSINYQGLEIKAFIYSFYHNSYIPM